MPAAIPKGYVFIARDILSSTLWERRPEDRIAAITAIVLANHQARKWCPNGLDEVHLARGQFARSWQRLSKACNMSAKATRTSFGHLEKAVFLSRKLHGKFSVFSIQKYEYYQDRDKYGQERVLPEGAILIARKILDSTLWTLPPQDRVVAITCLLMANYFPGSWSDGAHEVGLARGQFAATWEKLSEWCHLTQDEIEESMRRLESTEFIVRRMVEGCQVFTIPNYNYYQDASKYASQVRKIPHASLGELSLPGFEPEVTELTRQDAGRTPAGPRQDAGRTPAGCGQDPGRTPAANKKGKEREERKEGEGGSGLFPPSPFSLDSDLRGAPPPLPPEDRIAHAYHGRFEGIMGFDKARHQALLYLRRGGSLEEALQGIASHDNPEPIWKILDPLLKEKVKTGMEGWIPPEDRPGGGT
jgi:hypothetical protein